MKMIKMGNNYEVENNILYRWKPNYKNDSPGWIESEFQIGKQVILVESRYIGTKTSTHTETNSIVLLSDYPNGIPGNMNRNVCKFNGWRGTTNDISVYAEGVWTIHDIIQKPRAGAVVVLKQTKKDKKYKDKD